jgi:hypothetical protein
MVIKLDRQQSIKALLENGRKQHGKRGQCITILLEIGCLEMRCLCRDKFGDLDVRLIACERYPPRRIKDRLATRVSMFEEPGAGKSHAGICTGGAG